MPEGQAPLLIEVPHVAVAGRPTRGRTVGQRRTRRRLRRQVRIGGTLILMGLPLTWLIATLPGWGFGDTPRTGTTDVSSPPVVSLSLEPEFGVEPLAPMPANLQAAGDGERNTPVARPAGYLLPEAPDDPEDAYAPAGS